MGDHSDAIQDDLQVLNVEVRYPDVFRQSFPVYPIAPLLDRFEVSLVLKRGVDQVDIV
jgi:hypothetical protein